MGERQQLLRPEDMASTSTAVSTVPQPLQEEETVEPVAVITLRPPSTRAEARKKVVWTEDTVDNEDMNKKKSKCCCIYVKPKKFGESDSESSDSECEHCFGHVEKKRRAGHAHTHAPERGITIAEEEVMPERGITIAEEETASAEPTATVTLQPKPQAGPTEPAPSPPDKLLPAS